MGGIQAIDKSTVHKICSGQVILDLATAVKELIENSLDAGATSIEIRLKEHGSELIEVADNGHGVNPEDYQALMLKYHTSKLSSFDQLAEITSFGFRGEALSSLASLATVSVVTRTAAQETGSKLVYDHNGKLITRSPAPRAVGTTIAVQNLFQRLPVRHKEFLRHIKREYARLVSILQSYALISTNLRLICTNQVGTGSRSVVIAIQPAANIKDNITSLFGSKTAQSLNCVDIKDRSSKKGLNIVGFVSKATSGMSKAAGDRQFFYVNGRPIDAPKAAKIVNEVFRSLSSSAVATSRPMAVLDFRVSRDALDVNVTPDKRKVFLHDEKTVLEVLQQGLADLWEPSRSTYAVIDSVNGGVGRKKKKDKESSLLPFASFAVGGSSGSAGGATKTKPTNEEEEEEMEEEGVQEEDEEEQKENEEKENEVEEQEEQDDVNEPKPPPPKKKRAVDLSSFALGAAPPPTQKKPCIASKTKGEQQQQQPSLLKFGFERQQEDEKEEDDEEEEEEEEIVELMEEEEEAPMPQDRKTKSDTEPPRAVSLDTGDRDVQEMEIVEEEEEKEGGDDDDQQVEKYMEKEEEEEAYAVSVAKGMNMTVNLDRIRQRAMKRGVGGSAVTTAQTNYASASATTDDARKKTKFSASSLRTGGGVVDPQTDANAPRRPTTRKNTNKEEEVVAVSAAQEEEEVKAEKELERVFKKQDFSRMRVLGQFNLGFIIARLGSDLFIIDQHASGKMRIYFYVFVLGLMQCLHPYSHDDKTQYQCR